MIWIYTVCKGRTYPRAAGLGIRCFLEPKHIVFLLSPQKHNISSNVRNIPSDIYVYSKDSYQPVHLCIFTGLILDSNGSKVSSYGQIALAKKQTFCAIFISEQTVLLGH